MFRMNREAVPLDRGRRPRRPVAAVERRGFIDERAPPSVPCHLVWVFSWGGTPVLRPTSTSACSHWNIADSVGRTAGPGGPPHEALTPHGRLPRPIRNLPHHVRHNLVGVPGLDRILHAAQRHAYNVAMRSEERR